MTTDTVHPRGELSLRTVAMPADTNPVGDIFGGWIMSLDRKSTRLNSSHG